MPAVHAMRFFEDVPTVVLLQDKIVGRLIAGHGIGGGYDSHVVTDQPAVGHAVAIAGDAMDERHEQALLFPDGAESIFHAALHALPARGAVPGNIDGLALANRDAPGAADALFLIDPGFAALI